MSNTQPIQRVAVIMAGGSGERFWPLSRRLRPKQLLRLTSADETMLGEAVSRIAPLIPAEHVYIVTGEHLLEPIRETAVGVPDENVLAEPDRRNTAGALAYAVARLLAKYGGDGSNLAMAVLTADHVIEDADLFRRTVDRALEAAEREDCLATLGITPTGPETGYGYIQVPTTDTGGEAIPVWPVKAFHEKPDHERAEAFIAEGNYFWNAGMFFWKISAFLSELENARPEYARTTRAMAEAFGQGDEDLARTLFEGLESISIDYALMEQAKNVMLVRADFPWDDVGALTAMDRTYDHDADGNIAVGDPVLIDTANCIVYNEAGADEMAVSVIGVEDLVVIVTADAVLVVPKNRAQDVRRAVEELKRRGAKQV